LAGDVDSVTRLSQSDDDSGPDFQALFGDEGTGGGDLAASTKERFAPIAAFEEAPKPFFNDKNYYKNILAGAPPELAKRFHAQLTNFLNAADPQDRSMHRSRLIPAYWDLAAAIAVRAGPRLHPIHRMLLRFGALSATFLEPEQRDVLSRVVLENKSGESVHYVDEWLAMVAAGRVNASETDETKRVRKDAGQKNLELIDKRKGQLEAELSLLQKNLGGLDALESSLGENVKLILRHSTRPEYGNAKDAYSDDQKRALSELNDILRRLQVADREVAASYRRLGDLNDALEDLSEKTEGGQAATGADVELVKSEFQVVRQMAKMCVGRQGNHFPILMKSYFRAALSAISTRENVIKELSAIEALDPQVFHRSFRGQTNRIVPNIILVPCYGDDGVCWEPFERRNRASSRGRVAVPMYPKKVNEAVITAVADLRWQVAKEKAQHHWMEEGITGRYYQWFSDHKMKGDVKDAFVRDYILWITAESQGMQKLDREVRGIFWRMMPFPQETKDSLRNRGFVYNDLYKKDQNIARSDGY
jgi:hypothetical protein